MGTRNSRVFGSSEPTPEEPLRRRGAEGGSGSSPSNWIPNSGVQGWPVQSDDAVNSYVRLERGVVRLGRRINEFAYDNTAPLLNHRACRDCRDSWRV